MLRATLSLVSVAGNGGGIFGSRAAVDSSQGIHPAVVGRGEKGHPSAWCVARTGVPHLKEMHPLGTLQWAHA